MCKWRSRKQKYAELSQTNASCFLPWKGREVFFPCTVKTQGIIHLDELSGLQFRPGQFRCGKRVIMLIYLSALFLSTADRTTFSVCSTHFPSLHLQMGEVVVLFLLHPENQPCLPANRLWSCRDTPTLSLASTKAPIKPMGCFRPAGLSLVLKPVVLCSL